VLAKNPLNFWATVSNWGALFFFELRRFHVRTIG
jgi:hypothetical protein